MMTHVVGVDPGLVHTGVVRLVFRPDARTIHIEAGPVAGPDAAAVKAWVDQGSMRLFDQVVQNLVEPAVFIEAYRPRSHYDTDARMGKAVHEMKAALPRATVLNNTGVKQVVSRELMEALGCWRFAAVTNHQDLRSAARIALLGMLKDAHMNRLLADVVRDHLDGRAWDVRV